MDQMLPKRQFYHGGLRKTSVDLQREKYQSLTLITKLRTPWKKSYRSGEKKKRE